MTIRLMLEISERKVKKPQDKNASMVSHISKLGNSRSQQGHKVMLLLWETRPHCMICYKAKTQGKS